MTPLHFKIRLVRERQRLTQEYMADQLGISLKAYNELETGKTRIYDERLQEVAKILKTTPEAIYAYEDNFTQNNTFNEKYSNGVFINHGLTDTERQLYEQLLVEKDKRLAEKDELNAELLKRIATLKEMLALLKVNQ
jgi:transcriptional regulator with XRE-family HTH domain